MNEKFRIFDKQEKKINDTWDWFLRPDGLLQYRECGELYNAPEERFIKQFFTGLLDAGGKEIYEGDIIYNPMDRDKYHAIIWSNERAAWCLGADDNDSCNFIKFATNKYWKVKGNVMENPELLKETEKEGTVKEC